MKESTPEPPLGEKVAELLMPPDGYNREELLEHIESLRSIEDLVQRALRATVLEARLLRATWREIGVAIDSTPQNAHKRWGNS